MMYRLVAYTREQHPIDILDAEITDIDQILVARVATTTDGELSNIRNILQSQFPNRRIMVVSGEIEFLSLKAVTE